jgi:hypothetical protein
VGNKKMSLNASIRKKDGKGRENKRKERRTKGGRKKLASVHISYAFPLPKKKELVNIYTD